MSDCGTCKEWMYGIQTKPVWLLILVTGVDTQTARSAVYTALQKDYYDGVVGIYQDADIEGDGMQQWRGWCSIAILAISIASAKPM